MASKKFFVLLGDIDISVFSKSTFMNLANFAEKKCAISIIFLLDADHVQKTGFKTVFKMIDARRLGVERVKALVH